MQILGRDGKREICMLYLLENLRKNHFEKDICLTKQWIAKVIDVYILSVEYYRWHY